MFVNPKNENRKPEMEEMEKRIRNLDIPKPSGRNATGNKKRLS